MSDQYLDIINHERPQAPHPMSRTQRAAQFAPFAALDGFQKRINQIEQAARNHNLRTKEELILLTKDDDSESSESSSN